MIWSSRRDRKGASTHPPGVARLTAEMTYPARVLTGVGTRPGVVRSAMPKPVRARLAGCFHTFRCGVGPLGTRSPERQAAQTERDGEQPSSSTNGDEK